MSEVFLMEKKNEKKIKAKNFKLKDSWLFHGSGIAFIVLFVSLLLTFVAWKYNVEVYDLQSKLKFDLISNEIGNAVQDRINRNMDFLAGAEGLFASRVAVNSTVSKEEFSAFSKNLNLTTRYPSLLEFNFISSLKNSPSENWRDVLLYKGISSQEINTPLVEGYDFSNLEQYHTAIASARDTKSAQIVDVGKKIIVFIPLFGEKKMPGNEDFYGTIEAAFDTTGFFREIFSEQYLYQGMNFEVHIGDTPTQQNLLYSAGNIPSGDLSGYLTKVDPITFAGNVWTILFASTKKEIVGYSLANFPNYVAFGGLVASLSLFGIVLSFATARRRAVDLAENMTASLKERTHELETSKDRIEKETHKLNAILSSMGESLIVIANDGSIVRMNQAATVVLGIADGDAQGKKIETILPLFKDKIEITKEDSPIYKALADQSIARTLLRDNISAKDKEGNVFPVVLSATSLLGKGLDGIAAIVMFRDVTVEKSIDQAKTEFVSLAAHQLRTPLTAIGWYVEMLIHEDVGKINKKQKTYLDEIEHSNQRMVDLVNALLDVSHIDLGTFAVDPTELDLPEVSKSVLKELEPSIEKRKIKIEEKYGRGLSKVMMDQKLIRMVFQNLLSNAVKYTPEGGTVGVSIESKEEKLRIVVKDTGYGIPKAEQVKIFTKLYRAQNVRGKDTDGTGLGLYIVKAIVEQSGGSITFVSEENKGTTFYVIFPKNGMSKKKGGKELSKSI